MFTCLPLSLRAVVAAAWGHLPCQAAAAEILRPATPGWPAPVVREVTVRSVVVPLRRPLATKVGDFPRWPLLLIDVTTEQGITGRSYLAPYLDRAAAAAEPPPAAR